MSLVQGSINPRFTLGEPFLLLSSISTGTQGMRGLPLTIASIPNFYLCRNTSLSKTQGLPLIPKNARSTFGSYSYKTQGIPLVRSLVATMMTTINQRSKFNNTNYHQTIWQDLSIKWKSYLLIITIRREASQV